MKSSSLFNTNTIRTGIHISNSLVFPSPFLFNPLYTFVFKLLKRSKIFFQYTKNGNSYLKIPCTDVNFSFFFLVHLVRWFSSFSYVLFFSKTLKTAIHKSNSLVLIFPSPTPSFFLSPPGASVFKLLKHIFFSSFTGFVPWASPGLPACASANSELISIQ